MPKDTVYLIPSPGLRVVNPATGQPLPAEGAEVERDTYWIRRLNDGDVAQSLAAADQAPAVASAKPVTASSKKE